VASGIARCFCGSKCRHNSIKNDYCGGKPGLSPPSLILTLTLNPNPKDVTKPNPTDPTNPNRLTTNPSLLLQQSFSMLLTLLWGRNYTEYSTELTDSTDRTVRMYAGGRTMVGSVGGREC